MRTNAKRPTAGSNRRRARGRGRPAILSLAAAVLVASLLAASALASKEIVDFFGTKGGLGGQFNEPVGIAANPTGVGPADPGDIYVADRNNNRIQRFDFEGNFISAWGADVSLPDGGTDYEICTVASECQAAAASPGNGTTTGNGTFNSPRSVAIDQDTGDVYVADVLNRRISQYDGDGTFIRSFGFSVNATVAGTAYEICPATDVCKVGVGSSSPGVGQFHTDQAFDMYGLAVSPPDGNAPTGKVFLANSGARRVETYNLDGTSPANFGSAAVFADDQPRRIAVDSRGIVYASDSQNRGEVERYDSVDANSGGVGFLAPITAQNSTPSGPLLPGGSFEDPFNVLGQRNTADLAVDPDTDGAGPDEDALYVLRAPEDEPSSGTVVVQQIGPASSPGLTTPPAAVDDLHGGSSGFIFDSGPGVDALAVNGESGKIYLPGNLAAGPLPADHRVFVLDEDAGLPDPVATIGAATAVTDTTATFHATVDPMGGIGVTCAYEYSTDPGFAGSVEVPEPQCPALDAESGPQPLSEEIEGLDPNEHYFVRIVVTRFFAPASTVKSSAAGFDTEAVPPVVTDTGAIQVTDTSARLVGTIDPRNNPTGYVFEYGTTPALGSSTKPLDIGGGADPITVSQVVGGLAKDTTYYFRLVATNLTGTTSSVSKTFRTRATAPAPSHPGNCPNQGRRTEQGVNLPACRAYEIVSPPEKNQGGVGSVFGSDRVVASFSRDGEGVGFCSASLFGEPSGQQVLTCAHYLSRRGADGWSTINPFPKFCPWDIESGGVGVRMVFFAPESYDRVLATIPEAETCSTAPIVPGASLPSSNLYRFDHTTAPATPTLLSPQPGFEGANGVMGSLHHPFGGSEDFSHVVYVTQAKQTPDSPQEGTFRLYDWREVGEDGCTEPEGCIRLVTVDEEGEPFTSNAEYPGFSLGGLNERPLPGSGVSKDGERIFFQVLVPGQPVDLDWPTHACLWAGCELYMRESGTTTLHVSESECTLGGACGSDTSSGDNLLWTSSAGDRALFESCARLTDASAPAAECGDSGGNGSAADNHKLYRWDRSAPPGGRLVDLSLDNEPFDGPQPKTVDIVGASEDETADPDSNAAPGNTVFFVAASQLVAGEPTDEGLKLYRWRWNEGASNLDYLGPYLSSAENGAELGIGDLGPHEYDPNVNRFHDRVTADGRYLLIQTKLALDVAGDRDEDADLYRWEEADGWTCVSCQLPGNPSLGHVSSTHARIFFNTLFRDIGGHSPEHTITEDGKRVFFTTPDPLVPEDVNAPLTKTVIEKGEEVEEVECPFQEIGGGLRNNSAYLCADLYEWHDGQISLLSSGTSTRPVILMGATDDGRDVFFITGHRLVGWDTDTQADIYDARSGGGFPEPDPQPPACEGEGCRDQGTDAPGVAGAGTAVFQGAGNPSAETPVNRCPQGTLRRGKRCLSPRAIARKRCRRLDGAAKRRCIRAQTRRLRKAQRRRAERSMSAHRTDFNRGAGR